MAEFNEEKLVRQWASSLIGGNTYSAPVIHPGFKFVNGLRPEQNALYQTKAPAAAFKSSKMKG